MLDNSDTIRLDEWLKWRQKAQDETRLNLAISLLREHTLAARWPLADIIIQLQQMSDGVFGPALNDGTEP